MTKGKVVLVPFPLDDPSTTKVRPAVCLTDPIGPHRHVIIGHVTSRIPEDVDETDVVIDSKHMDFEQTGLKVSSALRLHCLTTINSPLIQRELGVLSDVMRFEVDEKLRTLFNLGEP